MQDWQQPKAKMFFATLENVDMKKTMIALAAMAATASFAQSSVTIGGIVEIAPFHTGTVTTRASASNTDEKLKSTRTAGPNTWATSVLNISGTEDLGGGLSASFFTMTGLGTLPNANTNATDGGIGNRERSISLSRKDLGTLRYGRFVAAPGIGFHSFSGAGSATLPGSSYGLSQANTITSGAFGNNNFQTTTGNYERQNNLLQFTSNSFGGVTAILAYGSDSLDNDSAATAGKTKNDYTGLQLGYAKGPLSLGLGVNSRKGETEATTAGVRSTTAKGSLNWIGASYNFGAFTLFAHNADREEKSTNAAGVTTTDHDINITGIGVSAPLGKLTLRASTYSGKDKRGAGATDNMKLSGQQLSAVYALSKRTSVVAATGSNEYKRDGAASTAATRKYQASTLTVVHTF